jgi:hypothetical protein
LHLAEWPGQMRQLLGVIPTDARLDANSQHLGVDCLIIDLHILWGKKAGSESLFCGWFRTCKGPSCSIRRNRLLVSLSAAVYWRCQRARWQRKQVPAGDDSIPLSRSIRKRGVSFYPGIILHNNFHPFPSLADAAVSLSPGAVSQVSASKQLALSLAYWGRCYYELSKARLRCAGVSRLFS